MITRRVWLSLCHSGNNQNGEVECSFSTNLDQWFSRCLVHIIDWMEKSIDVRGLASFLCCSAQEIDRAIRQSTSTANRHAGKSDRKHRSHINWRDHFEQAHSPTIQESEFLAIQRSEVAWEDTWIHPMKSDEVNLVETWRIHQGTDRFHIEEQWMRWPELSEDIPSHNPVSIEDLGHNQPVTLV